MLSVCRVRIRWRQFALSQHPPLNRPPESCDDSLFNGHLIVHILDKIVLLSVTTRTPITSRSVLRLRLKRSTMESQSTTLLSNPQMIPGHHTTSFFSNHPFVAPVATYPYQVPVPLDPISFVVSSQPHSTLALSEPAEQLPLHTQHHIFDPSLTAEPSPPHQEPPPPQPRPETRYQPLLHVHPHVIVQPTPGEPNSAITKKVSSYRSHLIRKTQLHVPITEDESSRAWSYRTRSSCRRIPATHPRRK